MRIFGVLILIGGTLFPAPLFAAPQSSPNGSEQVFTSTKEVRGLSPDSARMGLPVRVRGTVLVLSGWKNSFFFFDGHAGISIDRNDTAPELHSGDEVEVEGKSAAGMFAPIIVSDRVRILGKRKLPPAPLRDYLDLAGGVQDSQWVQIRGVVQAAWIAKSWGRDVLFVTIDMGGAYISVRVHDFSISDPSYLVDAEVTVHGVCATNFNERRQFVGLRLFVADMDAFRMEKAARSDPFDIPPQPLASIQSFAPRRVAAHRVRVQGTVTYQRLGSALYVQNDNDGIYVETTQSTRVDVGAKVDIVGFIGPGAYSPQLRAAIFRAIGSGEAAVPVALQASQIIAANPDGFLTSPYDALLVRLRGHLVERISGSDPEVLILRDADQLFRAYLPKSNGTAALSALRLGSKVELTGVIYIRSDETHEPRSFELRLRSPDDIAVLELPSWWDLRHTLYVMGFVTLAALGSFIAAAVLRIQVSNQVEVIRESLAARESALKELDDQKFALDQHAAVAVTDLEGTISYANDKFCFLSKYSRDELLGQNHRILNSGHHPKEFFAEMYGVITSGKVWHGEVKNRNKAGSLYWVDMTIVPALDAAGAPRHYVAIRTDITERKRAEAALEEGLNSQIRFKDEFLSHVSHELRTPLTAIKQFTTILLGGLAGELIGQQREFQQIILKNVLQLQSMIDDLLQVTRLETGKLSVEPESTSVADAVTDSINTLRVSASAKNISLSYDLRQDLPSEHADPTRLRQILIILLDNAIKFTPAAGAIKIQARLLPQDSQFVQLEVSDTGCGMSPEAAQRIFERLYQVEGAGQGTRNGLGLGLFICKELVTRQGGQIWVTSQPEQGSIFSFTVPVFSLRKLLEPLLKNNRWPAESAALIVVETSFVSGEPAKQLQEEWSREVRSLVGRCLLPDLDVLLPKFSHRTEGERFFVAAFADDKGASVLSRRIREQFERVPESTRNGWNFQVSYALLNPFPGDGELSVESQVLRMAASFEELVKIQNLETIAHVQ